MIRHAPSKQLRMAAVAAATTALVVSAAMSVSYARPLGTAGYGGYGAMSADIDR